MLLTCMAYCMLMSPTTSSASATLCVQSLMVFRVEVGMVWVGMVHALSPLWTPACNRQQQQQRKQDSSTADATHLTCVTR